MELAHNTCNVGRAQSVFDAKLEQPIDGIITLPEYCPDIHRMLRCSMEPAVHAVQTVGERVTVEGNARVTVLYAAEDGSLHSVEQNTPFSRMIDIPDLADSDAVTAVVKPDFANARATSQRRFDTNGMLGVQLRAARVAEDAVLTDVTGTGIQTLSDTVAASSLQSLAATHFPLSEVIEIDQGAPPVDQILLRHAAVVPGEVKAIQNKLLAKGNLETRVVYRSRGVDEPVQVLHVVPFSQIIEAPGVSEATENTLRLRVCALDIAPKADSTGAARLLDINARVGADVQGYAPVELTVIRDAYSTEGGVQPNMRLLETRRLAESFRDTLVAQDTFELGAQRVLLVNHEILNPEVTVKPDGLQVSGKVKLHVVYLDQNGNAEAAEKELPYTFARAFKGDDTFKVDVDIQLLNLQETLSGGNLDLRAELAVAGELFAANRRNVVGVVAKDEADVIAPRAPLTIYFASHGEPLWDIAKRYRTTMDAVRLENEITGETATGGQMLLIPSV
ncbi:MAG: DUF3794 domain-containing protein [Oscillospiraceae bacterium]|nr:DUF3794 domain-containing protein [Oscillospiraceae bacterium]